MDCFICFPQYYRQNKKKRLTPELSDWLRSFESECKQCNTPWSSAAGFAATGAICHLINAHEHFVLFTLIEAMKLYQALRNVGKFRTVFDFGGRDVAHWFPGHMAKGDSLSHSFHCEVYLL